MVASPAAMRAIRAARGVMGDRTGRLITPPPVHPIHGPSSDDTGGGRATLGGSGFENDHERGVVAQRVPWGYHRASLGGGAPDVRGGTKPRLQPAVHEGPIDPKTVSPVGRVPRIGALASLEEAEGVRPTPG